MYSTKTKLFLPIQGDFRQSLLEPTKAWHCKSSGARGQGQCREKTRETVGGGGSWQCEDALVPGKAISLLKHKTLSEHIVGCCFSAFFYNRGFIFGNLLPVHHFDVQEELPFYTGDRIK